MDNRIAHEINGLLAEASLAELGIGDLKSALSKLADISLPDMIAARDIVSRDNEAGVKNESGHRVYECVCADREIAAIYIKVRDGHWVIKPHKFSGQ